MSVGEFTLTYTRSWNGVKIEKKTRRSCVCSLAKRQKQESHSLGTGHKIASEKIARKAEKILKKAGEKIRLILVRQRNPADTQYANQETKERIGAKKTRLPKTT